MRLQRVAALLVQLRTLPMATKQVGKQANREAIKLKGSSALVTEFFKYAVNTYEPLHIVGECSTDSYIYRILFQREVYPSDDFHMVKKYGQTVLVTQDLALENYLERFF